MMTMLSKMKIPKTSKSLMVIIVVTCVLLVVLVNLQFGHPNTADRSHEDSIKKFSKFTDVVLTSTSPPVTSSTTSKEYNLIIPNSNIAEHAERNIHRREDNLFEPVPVSPENNVNHQAVVDTPVAPAQGLQVPSPTLTSATSDMISHEQSLTTPKEDVVDSVKVENSIIIPDKVVESDTAVKVDPISDVAADIPLPLETATDTTTLLDAQPVEAAAVFPDSVSFVTPVSDQPFESLVTLFDNELYLQQIIHGAHPMQEVSPTDLDVVDLFHQALNKGSYCVQPKTASSYSSYKTAVVNPLYTTLKLYIDLLHPAYVVEYKSSTTKADSLVGLKLASRYPFLSVVSTEYSGVLTGYEESTAKPSSTTASMCSSDQRTDTPMNYYRVKDPAQPSYLSSTGDCVQIIETLSFFVEELLPFEFEQAIGSIICQCDATFLPKYLPALPYFANWDSMASLVTAAVSQKCPVEFVETTEPYMTPVKYGSTFVVRKNYTVAGEVKPASSPLTVSNLLTLSLDSKSRYNLVAGISQYFEMQDVDEEYRDKLASYHELSFNGTTLINATSVSTLQKQASFMKYLSKTQSRSRSLTSDKTHFPSPVTVQSDVNLPASATTQDTPSKIAKDLPLLQPGLSASKYIFSSHAVASNSQEVNTTTTATSSSNIADGAATTAVAIPASEGVLSSNISTTVADISNQTSTMNNRRLMSSQSEPDNLGEESHNFAWILPSISAAAVSSENQPDWMRDDLDLHSKVVQGMNDMFQEIVGSSSGAQLLMESNHANERYYLSMASRQAQTFLYLTEKFQYHQWLHILQHIHVEDAGSTLLEAITSSQMKLVHLWGSQMSLLSLKLAKLQSSQHEQSATSSNHPLMVSVLTDSIAAKSHYRLLKVMKIRNNVIAVPEWNIATISALLASPERADMALIQSNILLQVLSLVYEHQQSQPAEDNCNPKMVYQLLATMLGTSSVSYVKFTDVHILQQSLDILTPQCAAAWSLLLADEMAFLQAVGAELAFNVDVSLSQVYPAKEDVNSSHLLDSSKVFQVKLQPSSTSGEEATHVVADTFWKKSSQHGLSLYTAVWLGMLREQKRTVLQLLVNLPVWKLQGTVTEALTEQLASWNTFIQLPRDSHANAASSSGTGAEGSKVQAEDDWRIMIHISDRTVLSSATDRSANIGVTSSTASNLMNELNIGHNLYQVLKHELTQHSAELANGKFSFVEHNSGNGYISTRLAMDYPQATIISVERNKLYTTLHSKLLEHFNITNNAVCLKTASDEVIYKNIYECPELFRFQVLFHHVLRDFQQAKSLDSWGDSMGMTLSSALTSFVYVPNRSLVSWALFSLFGTMFLYGNDAKTQEIKLQVHSVAAPYRSLHESLAWTVSWKRDNTRSFADQHFFQLLSDLPTLQSHPQKPFINFPSDWLLSTARAKGGSTSLLITAMSSNQAFLQSEERQYSRHGLENMYKAYFEFPMVRCDIVNMTRHVHHHYDYAKDGHSRTYTMRVEVNSTLSDQVKQTLGQDLSTAASVVDTEGVHLYPTESSSYSSVLLPPGFHPNQHSVVGVRLYRDKDSWPIPYVSIYGITIITALRIGLDEEQRERYFHSFLNLPLYEDMAPWNIVLMGPNLDYIDYDTRDFTFNADIPKAYKVMSVLMNYKRTVEDFKKCGSKASTIYGLPYVSDCVGGADKGLSCQDLALPVPCADGRCHSDYISCLRSLASIAEQLTSQQHAVLEAKRGGNNQDSSSGSNNGFYIEQVTHNLASAMNAVVAKFNESSYSKLSYDDFLSSTANNNKP